MLLCVSDNTISAEIVAPTLSVIIAKEDITVAYVPRPQPCRGAPVPHQQIVAAR